MEGIVDRLVSEGHPIKKVEIWHNKDNEKMFEQMDVAEERCGGVPFFLNQHNGKTLCGEVSYEEMKTWAEGK